MTSDLPSTQWSILSPYLPCPICSTGHIHILFLDTLFHLASRTPHSFSVVLASSPLFFWPQNICKSYFFSLYTHSIDSLYQFCDYSMTANFISPLTSKLIDISLWDMFIRWYNWYFRLSFSKPNSWFRLQVCFSYSITHSSKWQLPSPSLLRWLISSTTNSHYCAMVNLDYLLFLNYAWHAPSSEPLKLVFLLPSCGIF